MGAFSGNFAGNLNIPNTTGGSPHLIIPYYETSKAVGQGTWSSGINSGYFVTHLLQNSSAANLDNITFNIKLASGNYKILEFYLRNTNAGIIKFYLDGVLIATNDHYGAAQNNTLSALSAAFTASDGIHTLQIKVDGKNASSAGYVSGTDAIYFVPQ